MISVSKTPLASRARGVPAPSAPPSTKGCLSALGRVGTWGPGSSWGCGSGCGPVRGVARLRGRDAHGRVLLQHLREEIARRSGCRVAPSPDELEPLGDEAWVAHLRRGGGVRGGGCGVGGGVGGLG